MDKFNRNYELTIRTLDNQSLVVTPPFTLELDITRNTLTSANVCQLRIYNLGLQNRNRLRFNISNNRGKRMHVSLRAGYGNDLREIFTGTITQAWSVREGVNFITQIECFDGGFAMANGETNREFPAGTPYKKVVSDVMKDLPDTKLGVVGDYPGTTPKREVYSGNSAEILRRMTNSGFFIDNMRAFALNTDEYYKYPGPVLEISATSGLLGTPVLEQSTVKIDMIFEPSLNVGSIVYLNSVTENAFSGIYKVTAVKHRGIISESLSGTLVTSSEFFYNKLLREAR